MLEELVSYAVGLAPPIVLWLLYAAFRWRYLQDVRRTTYSPTVPESLRLGAPRTGLDPPLTIRWIDADAEARKPPPLRLVDARGEAWMTRAAFAGAGAVYILSAAAVVWHGQRAAGFNANAASAIAYASSLAGVFLIVAFVGRGWRSWMAAGTGWIGVAFVLLVWPLHATPLVAIRTIAMDMVHASVPLVTLAPLALRITRPLIVGFMPLVGLYAVCTAAAMFLLQMLGVSLAGHYTPQLVAGGTLAAVVGIAVAVRQIRRGVRRGFVLSLAAMSILGFVWSSYFRFSFIGGVIGGIGNQGLLTLVTWRLFLRFLHMKERGRLTDEVLHFSLCWFVLTAFLPAIANTGWTSFPFVVLTFVAYAVVLFLLLRHQGRRLAPGPPARLLLLRVFAQEPVRNRLLDVLDDSWRRVGRVDLIVGADLAIRRQTHRHASREPDHRWPVSAQ